MLIKLYIRIFSRYNIIIENSRKDKDMYDKLSNKHEKLVDELINMSRFQHSASENNININ